MEQITYSQVNIKKSHGRPPETPSAEEEDAVDIVYADIRTAASQSHLPAGPEVQEKTLTWRSHIMLIRVLIIVIVLLCGALVYMVYQRLDNHNTAKQNNAELRQRLCVNDTDNSSVYQRLDNHNTAKQNNAELRQRLCVNDPDNSSGCLLCPYGWFLHGDDCYYYSDVRGRTWTQSRDQCKMMGADLLVIKNQEQQEIIQRNLSQRVENTYWIGLRSDGDGWRWVDGEHYNSGLIQIKSQSPGRCVSLTKSGYNPSSCSSTNRWICVKRAVRI